jgi:predicted MFS family arabinose efflux permease
VAVSEPERTSRPPLTLIFSVTLVGILGNSLIAPGLPDLLDEFGVGDGGAGLVIAATSLPGVVMAPLIGILADRLGRRAVLVPCLVAFGASGIVVAVAPTFGVLLVGRFGMGLGAAGLINLAVVLIGDHWDGPERTRLIGRNAAVITVSIAVTPLLAGAITEWAGWRWAVAPYSLGLVVAWMAWRRLDGHRPPARTLRDQLGGLGSELRSPLILVTLASGFFVFLLVFGGFLTTMPLHLEREFALSAGGRGAMLSVPAVSGSLVAFNLGRIRRALRLRSVLVTSSVVMVLGFTVLAGVSTLWLVVVGASLYGLGEGLLIPALQDVAVQHASPEHRGGIVAVWVSAVRFGQTVGPLGAGAVMDASGTSTALAAAAGVAVLLVALVALGPFHDPT